jgi:transcriptional regulator with XRE-family HTH domain
MDSTEFGKRVLQVREKLLQMNQSELAAEINTTQVLLSRVERGVGGNINVVFNFLNFLKAKGYHAHMLLCEPFNIDLLTGKSAIESPSEKILNVISELKESANKDYEKLLLLLEELRNK